MTPIEKYLARLAALDDDPPLIADLTETDLGTSRGTASIARAALAWYTEGRPEQIDARLRDELALAELFARWRVRAAGLDVRGTTDWPRVLDVATARREYQDRWGEPA